MSFLQEIEKRIADGYEFASNVIYYLRRGHWPRDAINLARKVVRK